MNNHCVITVFQVKIHNKYSNYPLSESMYNWITLVLLLFFKSKFTTDTQIDLYLNHCTHGHIWSWTFAPFQASQGGCELFERYPECVGEVSLHCQLDLNTMGILNFSTHINLKNCSRVNAENKDLADIHRHEIFFLVLVWGTHS